MSANQELAKPTLGYLLMGKRPDSLIYVNKMLKACEETGLEVIGHQIDEDSTQEEVNLKVKELVDNKRVHGILIQLPLSKHINESEVIQIIGPEKDVDCLHPENLGSNYTIFIHIELALKKQYPQFFSCCPLACLHLLHSVIPSKDLSGIKVTICGSSNNVGLPLFLLLNRNNATVSLCHQRTSHADLLQYLKGSDIVITAIGKAKYFQGEWFKPGAIILDVGINECYEENANGEKIKKICGDVDFESAA